MQPTLEEGAIPTISPRHAEAFLRWVLIALGSLILTTAAPSASAGTSYPELNAFLSKFAMRPVALICESVDEDKGLWAALAYVRVPIGQQHDAYAREAICEGALAVASGDESVPDWKRAFGVTVIVHEAYHLRHWSGAWSEAEVECKTIRHFKVAVQLLGGSRRVADELFPVALAYHYQLVYFSKLRSGPAVGPGGESYEDLTCQGPTFLKQGNDDAHQEAASAAAVFAPRTNEPTVPADFDAADEATRFSQPSRRQLFVAIQAHARGGGLRVLRDARLARRARGADIADRRGL